MSLQSQESRLGREPTFRARQRDRSVCLKHKAAFSHLREEHLSEEDVLSWLPSF